MSVHGSAQVWGWRVAAAASRHPRRAALLAVLVTLAVALVATSVPAGADDSGGTAGASRTDRSGRAKAAPVVSAGEYHACAVRADASAWCWGGGSSGQLGDGRTESSLVPVRVSGDQEWAQVSAGPQETCGLTTTGRAWCWGTWPETVGGNAVVHRVPALLPGRWSTIGVGAGFRCALDAKGRASCWGYGGDGVLGTGSEDSADRPTAVSGNHTFTSLSVGFSATCGIDTSARLWCWGVNTSGQLGDGTTTNRAAPVRIGDARWLQVDGPRESTCGVQVDSSAWCWGRNQESQVSHPSSDVVTAPRELVGRGWTSAVSLGVAGCGLRGHRALWCWGDENALGATATGSPEPALEPRQEGSASPWLQVDGGNVFGCAVRADSRILCWGVATYGQLGHGAGSYQYVAPVVVRLPRA